MSGSGDTVGTVSSVARYPVKSLQGESLDEGSLTSLGLSDDRAWGIVHAETGHVLTAKRHGELLNAHAQLTPEGPDIHLPDGTTLRGPGPRTDAALSTWLQIPVSLCRAPDEATPFTMSFNVDDEDVDTFEWATPAGSFLDLAPIHLLTSAALAAAQSQHPTGTWSVHRFRPTLYIETPTDAVGFVENGWVGSTLAVGDAVLEVTMPTIRCSLPTKAQPVHGIERDLQVFAALTESNQQNLGAYATVRTAGTVRVGDAVTLHNP